MAVLLDDEACRIVHEAGNNGLAIVSFTGVGFALGGIQVEEFRRSLDGSSCDLYFVIDKKRHWYNGTADTISTVLNRSLRARAVSASFTLGNSMGGFGAVIFAGALHNCRRAVAFCPQSSVSPDFAPFENRWREWTGSIGAWRVPDAVPLMKANMDYTLFLGALDRRDLLHAERLAGAPGRTLVCVVDDCAHGVANLIKAHGLLAPLLGALLSPAPVDAARLGALMNGIKHRVLVGSQAAAPD